MNIYSIVRGFKSWVVAFRVGHLVSPGSVEMRGGGGGRCPRPLGLSGRVVTGSREDCLGGLRAAAPGHIQAGAEDECNNSRAQADAHYRNNGQSISAPGRRLRNYYRRGGGWKRPYCVRSNTLRSIWGPRGSDIYF